MKRAAFILYKRCLETTRKARICINRITHITHYLRKQRKSDADLLLWLFLLEALSQAGLRTFREAGNLHISNCVVLRCAPASVTQITISDERDTVVEIVYLFSFFNSLSFPRCTFTNEHVTLMHVPQDTPYTAKCRWWLKRSQRSGPRCIGTSTSCVDNTSRALDITITIFHLEIR